MKNNPAYFNNPSNSILQSPHWLTPAFGITVLLLLASALFLRPAIKSLSLSYQKTPADLRKPFRQFSPLSLPDFKNGWKIAYQKAQVEDLGTDQYLHIVFDRINKNIEPRRIELFLTYYNDPEDKIPHTPDVCCRQAGATVIEISSINLKIPALGPDHPSIPAQLFIYQNRGAKDYVYDIYFFSVCGKFRSTRNGVRLTLANPFNQRVYFSKIEAIAAFAPPESDPKVYIDACKNLIEEALPVLVNEFFPISGNTSD